MRIIEPGMVKTDFAGRSFDFSNDPALVEYQPSDRLRYEAGPDAEQMLGARRASNDAAFIGGMRAQFGLHGPG